MLSNLDGAVITKADGTVLAANDTGNYTVTGGKYYLYTDKTVAGADTTSSIAKLVGKNQTLDTTTYANKYEFTIPTLPADNGYTFSHTNNWSGSVPKSNESQLYVADGDVDVTDPSQLAAVLQSTGTFYYGDQPSAENVVINDGFGSIVLVEDVYLSNDQGTKLDLTSGNVAYGNYKLTAKVTIDSDGDGNLETGTLKTCTLYADVVYAARPMSENKYYLVTANPYFDAEQVESETNKKTIETPLEVVEDKDETGAPLGTYSVIVPDDKFTYNGTAQKPEIVVKNGGNNADVVASIPATDTADAAAKDYIDGVKAETNAGDYSYTLTAEAGTTEAPANYSGAVTVKWTIGKADIQQYISVVPKNNVDTDEVVGNDAIVYDGAVLDSTDFEVKTNEAYAALTDSEADKAIKALVDEFVAGLTAAPATETTPAVAAKTTVDVAPAIGKVYTENIEYETSGSTFEYSEENGYNTGDFNGKVINNNITINYPSQVNLSTQQVNINDKRFNIWLTDNLLLNGESKTGYISFNNFVIDSHSITLEYDSDAGTLKYGDYTISAKEGYRIGIQVIGTSTYSNNDNGYSEVIRMSLRAVPTSGLADGKSNIKDASVDGEVKKANVTVKNSNFKDVEFKQTLTNDGKIDTTVEDKSIPVTIAKRAATITPDEDNRITYRDLTAPTLNYEYEKAATEEALLRGVIAADEGLFDSTRDGYVAPIKVSDFNIGELNDAKSYNYEIVDSEVFANYELSLPTENVPTFTVDPLNLNDIEGLGIVLNGKNDGWTQDGNSGYYTYDGSSKSVEVTKVAKANTSETAQTQTVELLASETTGVTDPYIKDGFTLKFGYWSSQNPNVIGSIGSSTDSVKIIVPADKIATKITVDGYYCDFLEGEYIAFSDLTNFTTEFEGNYTGTVSMKDVINYNDLTSYHDGMIYFSKITVTYKDADEYALTADTDYTVGGMTKSATVGEKTVQVKGKGNYTGVAKATWDIVAAEAGGAELTFTGMTAGEENDGFDFTKTYDGKEVTPKVIFGEPDSYYALDADVDIKYYDISSIDGGLDGINTDDLDEVAAPVNAGRYVAAATITCEGYATQILSKVLNIEKADLTVEASAKNKTMNYGEELPAVTAEDIAAINGLTAADRAFYEQLLADGKLKFDAPANTNTLVPMVNGELTEDEMATVQNFTKNYNLNELYWNLATKAKSIKSDDVTVEFANGNTVVLDENGFVSESSIIIKDTGILNDDGEPTVLLADTDYELNLESTATEGEYIVEIVGKGNYRGIRKVTFTAITAAKAATKLDVEFVETYVSNNKNRIKFNASAAVKDGYTVKETGVIYFNAATGTPEAELTMDNVDGTNIKKARNLADSYTVGLLDNGNGVYARFYTIVNDGTNDYVVYATDEAVVYNYAEMSAKAATKLDVEFVETYVSNNKNRIKFNASAAVKDGYTVKETGVIYFNAATGTPEAELTMDNVDGTNIKKARNLADSYTVGLLDNGNGVYARFYTIVNDGTNDYVVYATDEAVVYNYAELSAQLS